MTSPLIWINRFRKEKENFLKNRHQHGLEEEDELLFVQRRVHLHGGLAAVPGRLDVHQRARHRRRHAPHRHVQESRTHSAVVRQSECRPATNFAQLFSPLWLDYWPPATYCGLRPFRSGISINNRDSPPMYGMAYYTPDLCMWMLPIDKNTRTKKDDRKKVALRFSCFPKKFQNSKIGIFWPFINFCLFFFFLFFLSAVEPATHGADHQRWRIHPLGKVRETKNPQKNFVQLFIVLLWRRKKKSLVVVHNTHNLAAAVTADRRMSGPSRGRIQICRRKEQENTWNKQKKNCVYDFVGLFLGMLCVLEKKNLTSFLVRKSSFSFSSTL